MSIAERNELEDLKRRVAELEELVRALTAKRETLTLKDRKRG